MTLAAKSDIGKSIESGSSHDCSTARTEQHVLQVKRQDVQIDCIWVDNQTRKCRLHEISSMMRPLPP
eukprot:93690-Amphidinium_carterae.1